MKLPETILIRPLTVPVQATVSMVGSKSITNRTLVLAALAKGKSVLKEALWAEDTEVMVECLRKLGFAVEVSADSSHPSNRTFTVEGLGGRIPKSGTSGKPLDLYVANAGTAARFLTAMVCLGRGCFRIDGTPRMQERPIGDLLDALRQLGISAKSEKGNHCLPILIESHGLKGGKVQVSGEKSSQFASALMLISGCSAGNLTLRITGKRVSEPFLDLTAALMKQASPDQSGIQKTASPEECRFQLPSLGYQAREWQIEPDATAASYPLAMAAILGGKITVQRLNNNSLQGDIRFWRILREHSGNGILPRQNEECSLEGKWEWAHEAALYFAPISDTFITMAVIAPFGKAPLTMTGLGHTRLQESDRLAAVVAELGRAGVQAEAVGDDSLRVLPCPSWREATIHTYHDHRMAMAFSVLGLRDVMGGGKPWLRIENPSCVGKTFPGFFEFLEKIALQSCVKAGQPYSPVVLTAAGKPVFG